jgi:nicotinate-nucleotide adenylyltransferase
MASASHAHEPRVKGIFGGTFDPVHYGHLRAASEATEFLGLTDLRLIPAGTPPHRPPAFAAAGHRLNMLQLALAGHQDLWADDREVRRQDVSYMVDTLGEIRLEEGDVPLLLLVGQDAVNSLDSWHRWRQLFKLAHIVILHRPDSAVAYSDELLNELQPRSTRDLRGLRESPAGLVYSLEVTQLAISATDIRRQIAGGKSPRFLLPDGVIQYIRDNGLYARSCVD